MHYCVAFEFSQANFHTIAWFEYSCAFLKLFLLISLSVIVHLHLCLSHVDGNRRICIVMHDKPHLYIPMRLWYYKTWNGHKMMLKQRDYNYNECSTLTILTLIIIPCTILWFCNIFVRYVTHLTNSPTQIPWSNTCLHEMVMWLIIWPTCKTVSVCWNGVGIAVCNAMWFTTTSGY